MSSGVVATIKETLSTKLQPRDLGSFAGSGIAYLSSLCSAMTAFERMHVQKSSGKGDERLL